MKWCILTYMLVPIMLFTGSGSRSRSKKQRTDEGDEVQDELDGNVNRRKQNPVKSVAKKVRTASQIPDKEFVARRSVNVYVIDRMDQIASVRGNNPHFHTKFQEQCYHEILLKKPVENYVEQHFINMDHLNANLGYFGEALAICEEFGLIPMMKFEQDFDEKLVAQFLATVHFGTETERTLTWMTKDKKMSEKWSEIAIMLGYEDFGSFLYNDFDDTHFRVHHTGEQAVEVEKLLPLYDPESAVTWKVGMSKGLFPTWDIMHRIYRETINPKVGNIDEIHGYLKNLMLLTRDMQGKGKKLDVMDFIWHEMWDVIIKKKNIAFAPLIMRIIIWKWIEKYDVHDLGDVEKWVPHKSKRLLIKAHPKKKKKDVVDEAGPSHTKKDGPFKWMASSMKKLFKLTKQVERNQYNDYEAKMKTRQAEIAHRRAQGEQVQSGSEKNITPWEEWQAQDSEGQVITWADYEEDEVTSQQPQFGFE